MITASHLPWKRNCIILVLVSLSACSSLTTIKFSGKTDKGEWIKLIFNNIRAPSDFYTCKSSLTNCWCIPHFSCNTSWVFSCSIFFHHPVVFWFTIEKKYSFNFAKDCFWIFDFIAIFIQSCFSSSHFVVQRRQKNIFMNH